MEAYLELALKNSDALKFTLAQVAAKFGSIKRYREGRGRFGGDRLLAALEGTPVYDEALREVFHADLAVGETAELLEDVQDGSIDLAIARERTPLGIAGRSSGTEFLVPENADADVIETIRERIRNDRSSSSVSTVPTGSERQRCGASPTSRSAPTAARRASPR